MVIMTTTAKKSVVIILGAPVAGKSFVGSSRIKIEGLDTSSMSMHNRLRSPPLMDVLDLARLDDTALHIQQA